SAHDFAALAGFNTGAINVADFTDDNPFAEADDFDVTVHWGDGGTSDGVVSKTAAGQFDVTADHTYASGDDLTFTVDVVDHEGSADVASGSVSVAATGISSTTSLSALVRANDPERAQLNPIGEASVSLNTGDLRLQHPLDFDLSPGTDVGG